MKMQVDTSAIEDALRGRLQEGKGSDPFLEELCGPILTNESLLNDLETGGDLAQDVIRRLAQASLRIFVLRGLR